MQLPASARSGGPLLHRIRAAICLRELAAAGRARAGMTWIVPVRLSVPIPSMPV